MLATLHERFHYRNIDEFRAAIDQLRLAIPVADVLSPLSAPLIVAGRTAPNRFVANPMEGADAAADGGPGPLSVRRYLRYARGGFGLIWFEATAVLQEARSHQRQLFLNRDSAGGFRKLVADAREAARETFGRDIVTVLQLTHSGRYSKPTGVPKPLIAHHSPVLDPAHRLPEDYPLVSDEYLDRLQDAYVDAARLAAEAGFDGVDIKSCHGYLVSELLASFTREGRYGGCFENRARLLLETLARVKQDVPGIFITTRMAVFDAIDYPYGFGVDRQDSRVPDLTEPLELAGRLRELGIPLLNISTGNPYLHPHYSRPFDFPVRGMRVPDEHPLAGVDRILGITRRVQEAFPGLPVVGGGYSWLRQFLPNVAAGVLEARGATLIGIGRGALAYPDAVKDILDTGRMDPAKCCVTCSACTQMSKDDAMIGCVVRDGEIYGPQYRLGRRFALDWLQEEARRCRACEEPTCVRGCPVHVGIPAFIRAFAGGDLKGAYDILRERIVLPEMSACVCPVEAGCESGCIEKSYGERPIPIGDIQLVVCRIARREGYVGVRLPEKTTDCKVAIVGGGPAGVAAAIRLLELGHLVTIVEAGPRLGGTRDEIMAGDCREDVEREIEAILAPAERTGRLGLHMGRALGRDIGVAALCGNYDAVLLAMDSGKTGEGQAEGLLDALKDVALTKEGLVRTEPDSCLTSQPGVYAVGDVVSGRTTVVEGIVGGMRAAEEMGRFLEGARQARSEPAGARPNTTAS